MSIKIDPRFIHKPDAPLEPFTVRTPLAPAGCTPRVHPPPLSPLLATYGRSLASCVFVHCLHLIRLHGLRRAS